jgi:hypothetical protein
MAGGFYCNVELWWEWEVSGLCAQNHSYLLFDKPFWQSIVLLVPIPPPTLSACRVENLNEIRKKVFAGRVPRFFPLQRYKICVCLLLVLYHNYTDRI